MRIQVITSPPQSKSQCDKSQAQQTRPGREALFLSHGVLLFHRLVASILSSDSGPLQSQKRQIRHILWGVLINPITSPPQKGQGLVSSWAIICVKLKGEVYISVGGGPQVLPWSPRWKNWWFRAKDKPHPWILKECAFFQLLSSTIFSLCIINGLQNAVFYWEI